MFSQNPIPGNLVLSDTCISHDINGIKYTWVHIHHTISFLKSQRCSHVTTSILVEYETGLQAAVSKVPPFHFFSANIFFSRTLFFVHQNSKTMRLGAQTQGNQPTHQILLRLWVHLKTIYPSPFWPSFGITVGYRGLYTAFYSHV